MFKSGVVTVISYVLRRTSYVKNTIFAAGKNGQ